MKARFLVLLSLALFLGGAAHADEQKKSEKAKANAKKSAKAKSSQKSSQNIGQKAESSVGKALHDSKIWTRSESRSR